MQRGTEGVIGIAEIEVRFIACSQGFGAIASDSIGQMMPAFDPEQTRASGSTRDRRYRLPLFAKGLHDDYYPVRFRSHFT
jgi:hypothetical protein